VVAVADRVGHLLPHPLLGWSIDLIVMSVRSI
jgi:hypothetical protein